ncbi:MAG: phospholipase D-like domain-containing protein [Hyphomonadaceae bacterium]|nr:phospholipase D-like domain-containing protein [Hyphomonadaceae bacterium]
MAKIISATAIANNEVAFLAWQTDPVEIEGCLGFHIVREYLDGNDKVISEKPLAAYVGFNGQRNPEWNPQNTSVWPVQKYTWRDLTLRKKRDAAERRAANERVRYRIRAVGRWRDGLEPVVPIEATHWDATTRTWVPSTYEGKAVPLSYLTPPMLSNAVDVTASRPPFYSTFTNGILSTQFLVNALKDDDEEISEGELAGHLKKPGDKLRRYLSGDVIETIRDFFAQPKGSLYAALYELEDEELLEILLENVSRLNLILSDAGSGPDDDAEPKENGKKQTKYDTRNDPARKELKKRARQDNNFVMIDRMFNGSGHIGHNKFVVHVDGRGKPTSVLTGSTNWTWSGIAAQSNNCVRIDDPDVAAAFLQYWEQLRDDPQKAPKPTTAKAEGAGQGDALKEWNQTPITVDIGGGAKAEIWFSPNVPGKNQPPSKKAKKPSPPPPDMDRLFSLIRKAREAIFFAVFLPSRGGFTSIVEEAIQLGTKDTSLIVHGAISDTQAMWGFEPSSTSDDGKKIPSWSPHIFRQNGVSVIRATALTDREIGRDLGDFQLEETLTTGKAIIHDKVLVIDPQDPERCVVAFGSHNLGYKASYSNDENLVIVRGHQALAQAYAVHVLDIYDHYRFRAAEAEVAAAKKGRRSNASAKDSQWDGFLDTSDNWQENASRRLSRYFAA